MMVWRLNPIGEKETYLMYLECDQQMSFTTITLKEKSGSSRTSSLCSTLLVFADDPQVLVHLTLYCWASNVVTSYRETHQRSSHEVPAASCSFHWPEQLVSLVVSSGLNCHWWFMCGVYRVNWTAAVDLCSVFATGLRKTKFGITPKNYL